MRWLRRVNEYAGDGVPGAVRYIEEVLELGYEHLIPITNKMNPLAATGGIDAMAILFGGVLFVIYLVFRLARALYRKASRGSTVKPRRIT